MECGEILEEFSNDDLGLCIIILSTFVYRQPGLAAPLLPRMLKTVARYFRNILFFVDVPNKKCPISILEVPSKTHKKVL